MSGVMEWFRCCLLFTITGAIWSVDMTRETLNRKAFFHIIIRLKQKRCNLRQCLFWFNRRCRVRDDL